VKRVRVCAVPAYLDCLNARGGQKAAINPWLTQPKERLALPARQRTEGATARPATGITNSSAGRIVACRASRTARALHGAPAVGHALAYPAAGVAVLVKRDTATRLGAADFASASGDTLARAVGAGQVAIGVAKAAGGIRPTSGEEQDKRRRAGIDSWDRHSS